MVGSRPTPQSSTSAQRPKARIEAAQELDQERNRIAAGQQRRQPQYQLEGDRGRPLLHGLEQAPVLEIKRADQIVVL